MALFLKSHKNWITASQRVLFLKRTRRKTFSENQSINLIFRFMPRSVGPQIFLNIENRIQKTPRGGMVYAENKKNTPRGGKFFMYAKIRLIYPFLKKLISKIENPFASHTSARSAK